MKTSINHGRMRSSNKRFILDYIRKNGPVSKKEISDRLKMSFTAVTTFVSELLTENTIVAHGNAKSSGGRKSELFQPNPDAFYVFGADIQVDRLVILLQDFCGNLRERQEIPLTQSGERYIASLLSDSIRLTYQKTGLPQNKLAGIGISVPGIVNSASGLVELAPNLNWRRVDLQQLLQVRPVVIANEANAAAFGELYYGFAQEAVSAIFLSVGHGIGSGLIFDHRLFAGGNFIAGEFGHMSLDPHGPVCRCGKRGCWETYASNEAALRLYEQLAGRKPPGGFETIIDLYQQNNPIAQRIIRETVYYLGVGISNLINGLNPELIVIGGSLGTIGERVYPELLNTVKGLSLAPSFDGVAIRFSKFGNDAAALGAASMAIDRHLNSI
jgi:predicted NBD/HSP70 family sugar kinase